MEADWRESPGPTLPWPSMEINQTTAVVGAQTAPARAPHRGARRAGLDPDPGPGQRDRRGAGRGQGPDQPLLGLGALDVQAQR
ncbi:hypothetical protein G6F59_018641 [Rhizopus arrhizus]|nr:hypothetical protein G6F59_018641 [Rhizopus arrhizus]